VTALACWKLNGAVVRAPWFLGGLPGMFLRSSAPMCRCPPTARIGPGVRLKNCIVLDGTEIEVRGGPIHLLSPSEDFDFCDFM